MIIAVVLHTLVDSRLLLRTPVLFRQEDPPDHNTAASENDEARRDVRVGQHPDADPGGRALQGRRQDGRPRQPDARQTPGRRQTGLDGIGRLQRGAAGRGAWRGRRRQLWR